jgi:hypothetical protein
VLGKPDAAGRYGLDPHEPPFTQDELDEALRMIVKAGHDPYNARRDFCPHTPRCADAQRCLEDVAWFLRYSHELNR